ncbi:hypothetical protein Anapl_02785 [Anas platyrhynchos]|uniref:Uncharacterized protein n=1 Tax=Anas platyrhynchos TaxID=8839 RepID=R0K4E2_ANAPL|nr:hypothetical protein Anapl_02785 [Anas platyrhynchos]
MKKKTFDMFSADSPPPFMMKQLLLTRTSTFTSATSREQQHIIKLFINPEEVVTTQMFYLKSCLLDQFLPYVIPCSQQRTRNKLSESTGGAKTTKNQAKSIGFDINMEVLLQYCSVSACSFCHNVYEMKKHLSVNSGNKQMINVFCKKLKKISGKEQFCRSGNSYQTIKKTFFRKMKLQKRAAEHTQSLLAVQVEHRYEHQPHQ